MKWWTSLTPTNHFKIYIEKLYKYSLKLCRLWMRHSIGKTFTIKIYVIVYFKFSVVLHWTQTKIKFLLLWRLNIKIIILFHLYIFFSKHQGHYVIVLLFLFNMALEVLARANGQENKIKYNRIGKEEVKMSAFEMMLCIENPEDSTK